LGYNRRDASHQLVSRCATQEVNGWQVPPWQLLDWHQVHQHWNGAYRLQHHHQQEQPEQQTGRCRSRTTFTDRVGCTSGREQQASCCKLQAPRVNSTSTTCIERRESDEEDVTRRKDVNGMQGGKAANSNSRLTPVAKTYPLSPSLCDGSYSFLTLHLDVLLLLLLIRRRTTTRAVQSSLPRPGNRQIPAVTCKQPMASQQVAGPLGRPQFAQVAVGMSERAKPTTPNRQCSLSLSTASFWSCCCCY
jgi:hypothetical protein